MQSDKCDVLSPSLNFQVFYRSFSRQKIGAILASLLQLINFLQIFCFIFSALFRDQPLTSTGIDYLMDFASYFEMITYLDLNQTLYSAMRFLASFLNLVYLVLFVSMRYLIKQNTTVNSVEQLFSRCNMTYVRIFMLATCEIMFREVFCDQTVLSAYSEECFKGVHIPIFILSMAGIIAALTMAVLTAFYSLTGIYDKHTYFSGENRLFDILIIFTKILLPILIAAGEEDSDTFRYVYVGINEVLSLSLLWCFFTYYPYNRTLIEYFTLGYLILYWAQSTSMGIFMVAQEESVNTDLVYFLLTITSVPAITFVYITKKRRLIVRGNITSPKLLLRQIQITLQLKQTEKLESLDEIYFRGLITKHRASCHNFRCFCKADELYAPTKNKSFERAKWPTLKPLVLKYYVRTVFEEAIERGISDSDLLISYAEFLFQKFRNCHLALHQVAKLLNLSKFLYPHQRFRIFKLRQKISAYISLRNLEALETPLEVENVVFVEEQLEKVIAGMRQIISTSIGFWSYLYGKEVDLNNLKTLAEEMSGAVEETIRLWVPLKPYLYKQKRIMYYYNWFLKDFLQEKIILSEDEVDSLFDNDTDSVYSNEFLGALKEDNIIFQEDTAVIHMSGNSTDLGNIIKTNQGAMKLFGYRKEQMEKHNIDMLMPKLIARKHNYYLNTYVTTGKSQVLYDQMKTFAKSRKGYVMPVWIVIKQLNNIDGLIQYAGLIQPLSQKKDEYNHYILLNNYGEISGISKNLAEFFNIPGNIFEKSDVNVIMLAPKLIKYFFFAKVLQGELASGMTSQHMLGTLFTMSPGLKRRGATRLTDKITSIMGGLTKKNPLQEFLDLDTLQREDTIMHNENEDDHGSILSEDIPGEKSNEINIEFTMRLPKKLKRFIKEFNRQKSRHNELLNNQQVLFEAIHSKTLEKAVSGEKSLHSPDSPTLKGRTTQDLLIQSQTLGRSSGLITSPKTKKKTLGHLANFKHAIDSYVGALKMTASKIARTGLNNVYRIKGVLVTDYYGPDKDIVKYIKILEITKKAERFTRLSALTPANRISGSNDVARWSRSSTISQQGASRPGRKSLKTSTFKTERLNEEDQAKNPYEDSSGPSASRSGLSEDGSPSRRKSPHGSRSKSRDLSSESSRSRSLKNQDSFNSQKSEFQLDEEVSQPSQADSDKKAIMNELKTNIMTHTASIYHKEDNLMIDKKFPSLRNVKWFIRVLFLSLVPLNLIIYLVGPYDTFRQLENSVSDIYANENLRRHYIRSHDTIMTLILDNSGFFDSLRPEYDTRLDSMVTEQMSNLNTQYSDIYQESSKDEWTTIVYNYATRAQKETTLNYQGSFEGSVTDIQNAIQTLTNSLFQIQSYSLDQFTGYDEELSFYRINCLEKFNKILGDATNIIFESLDQGFGNSENLSITILLSEGLMFTVSFFIILRLILIVITSLREVLIIFTVIDPQQIIETEMYYRRLLEYMEVSNRQYFGADYVIQHAIPAKEAIKAKSFKPYDDSKQKLQKKTKKINYGRFMRADSIKILSYYVLSILLCFSLSLLFHFESKTTIDYIQDVLTDSQRFIQLSPVYITSLVGLKELTFNKTNYQQFDLPCLQDTINVLDQTLSRTGFSSDISFVNYFKSILDGTPCEAFKDVIANSDDLINCLILSDGRLSTGLITFHNYYKGEVVDILTLNADEHFGVVGPLEIYEYSELIKIIDKVFMDQALITWKSAIETYLKSKENFLIILIVVVSILNVGVYFVAKTGVVGILKNRFSFYRKIYNKYMLGEAPVKEKRIKAVLVKYKLLHK